MTNPNFQKVVDRLQISLGINSETDLGKLLGFTQSAWSTRKMRDSLPRAQIDALIAAEGINPHFIYQGEGSVYEGTGWVAEYKARAAELRSARAPLIAEIGHPAAVIDALINMDEKDKYKATAYAFVTALRDSFRLVEVDLTHLITGVALSKDTDKPMQSYSKDEQAVIQAYRAADKTGQEFIRRAAGMAKK